MISYTEASSANGIIIGDAKFPLNPATFRAQHGSMPQLSTKKLDNTLVPCEVALSAGNDAKLETHGFELVSNVRMARAQDFDLDLYKQDLERIACDLTGASCARAYCSARRAPSRSANSTTTASYAPYAHTDQAHLSWSALLPDIVDDWTSKGPPGITVDQARRAANAKRYAIVSAWRFLGPTETCTHSHLALLDPRSLQKGDVLHFELRTVNGTSGSNYRLKAPAPAYHKWSYFPGMHRDRDILFFTVFDTHPQFPNAHVTPAPTIVHSAFLDPNAPPNAPPRESIDVRLLLVWDD